MSYEYVYEKMMDVVFFLLMAQVCAYFSALYEGSLHTVICPLEFVLFAVT